MTAAGPSPRGVGLDAQLAKRLRWLIAVRLLVITSVLLPYILLELSSLDDAPLGVASGLDFVYFLAIATYGASLLYILLDRLLGHQTGLQAWVQFTGDLLLVTGLVYNFGGTTSPFSILYLIVVIVASILLRRRAGLAVATVAWALYAAAILSIAVGWIHPPHGGGSDEITTTRLVYSLAIHLFGFYAVALMTSRLAQSVTVAERELIEKREDLAELQVAHRDVIESIPSGLMTTDPAGIVTSANRAAVEILGSEESELVGKPIQSSGLFTEEVWESIEEFSPSEARERFEVDIPVGDRTLTIGYSVSRLTRADGTPGGRIVIFQDLSQWKRLQEELQTRDRMAAVGKLAAGLAHEIGNPLAAISGSVQLLTSSLESRERRRKLVEILLKESQRLDRTVKRFLKFARPTERSSVRFDIGALIEEHVELLRNSPEVSPEHRIEVELDPPSAQIIADPDQISQILWNLARNALRAMPEGGVLTIRGTVSGGNYGIAVIDTGRGMTDKERANLFHPFQSFFDGGTGIGMAIVYQIVQEHGGRLGVDSRPDHGTAITVELPITPGAVAVRPTAEA